MCGVIILHITACLRISHYDVQMQKNAEIEHKTVAGDLGFIHQGQILAPFVAWYVVNSDPDYKNINAAYTVVYKSFFFACYIPDQ